MHLYQIITLNISKAEALTMALPTSKQLGSIISRQICGEFIHILNC